MANIRKQWIIEYEHIKDFSLLPMDIQHLFNKTVDFLPNAYVPYSDFRVSAGMILEDGQILTNVNQENVSFPVGICAERALLAMKDGLGLNQAVKAIAVAFQPSTQFHTHDYIAPCGMCRQALLEYEQRNQAWIPIYLLDKDHQKALKFNSIHDLLPFSFAKIDG